MVCGGNGPASNPCQYASPDFIGQITFTGSENPQGINNPFADLAEGLPSGSLHFVGNSARSYRITSYDFFAQDTFKLRPNLTLSLGLRYEIQTNISDHSDLAPRISAAWASSASWWELARRS